MSGWSAPGRHPCARPLTASPHLLWDLRSQEQAPHAQEDCSRSCGLTRLPRGPRTRNGVQLPGLEPGQPLEALRATHEASSPGATQPADPLEVRALTVLGLPVHPHGNQVP